jgi:hypothetical protein
MQVRSLMGWSPLLTERHMGNMAAYDVRGRKGRGEKCDVTRNRKQASG